MAAVTSAAAELHAADAVKTEAFINHVETMFGMRDVKVPGVRRGACKPGRGVRKHPSVLSVINRISATTDPVAQTARSLQKHLKNYNLTRAAVAEVTTIGTRGPTSQPQKKKKNK